MFQAFLIVSFLANVCYSNENLALNKNAKHFHIVPESVDGDRETMEYCMYGECRIVVDLGTVHMIKTVEIYASQYCPEPNFVYSIRLQKNRTSAEYKCSNPDKHPMSEHEFIACDSNEAYQFVTLSYDLGCKLIIQEIGVFGNSSSNLALNKDAILYVGAPESVDGSYKTYSRYPASCHLMVDLGAFHTIDTVIVTLELYSTKKEFVYSIGLQNNKINVDYNCQSITKQSIIDEHLDINDTITCISNKRNRFVVFRGDHDFECSFKEIQVFGTTSIATTATTTKAKDISPTEPNQPTEPPVINSAIGMKIDWSCYLAILLVVLFSSVSLVHHVFHHLSFLGTNLIGVVVGMQGRKNNEE